MKFKVSYYIQLQIIIYTMLLKHSPDSQSSSSSSSSAVDGSLDSASEDSLGVSWNWVGGLIVSIDGGTQVAGILWKYKLTWKSESIAKLS